MRFRFALIAACVLAVTGCLRDPELPGGGGGPPTSPPPPDTSVTLLEDFSARQIFPVSNWWNLDIHAAPIDPGSQATIDWISGRTPSNPSAVRRLHPDFGPPPYGIPYVGVAGTQGLERVLFSPYGSESDSGAPGRPAGYPIPIQARTGAGYLEGNVAGGGAAGDRHLLIIDRDHFLLFESFA